MSDTRDEPGLCPDCEGLTVTSWARLDITHVRFDDGPELPVSSAWITPTPEPCPHHKPEP